MSWPARRSRFLFLWLFCAALVATACSDAGAPSTEPDVQAAVLPGTTQYAQELAAARSAQAAFTDELMARPGVVGTAVGLGASGSPIVLVLVEDASVTVPGRLGGVGARLFVTGRIDALQEAPRGKGPGGNKKGGQGGGGGGGTAFDPTARLPRPVPIGVSTGHPAITAGTIGARVTDGTNVFVLSNNHVYANMNLASIGDAVIQPGTYDGGESPADDIGALAEFKKIDFEGGNNTIDAAIASTTTGMLGDSTGPGGYGKPMSTTTTATLNMPVQKCGRTTGCTSGKVYAINAVVDVGYGPGNVARFVGQIIITPGSFSAGGDSGSLIVGKAKGKNGADDRKPVGLLFAGSSLVTIANPIDAVLDTFGVSIDGG